METKHRVFMFFDNERMRQCKSGPCKRLYVIGGNENRGDALDEAEDVVRYKLTGESRLGGSRGDRGPPPRDRYDDRRYDDDRGPPRRYDDRDDRRDDRPPPPRYGTAPPVARGRGRRHRLHATPSPRRTCSPPDPCPCGAQMTATTAAGTTAAGTTAAATTGALPRQIASEIATTMIGHGVGTTNLGPSMTTSVGHRATLRNAGGRNAAHPRATMSAAEVEATALARAAVTDDAVVTMPAAAELAAGPRRMRARLYMAPACSPVRRGRQRCRWVGWQGHLLQRKRQALLGPAGGASETDASSGLHGASSFVHQSGSREPDRRGSERVRLHASAHAVCMPEPMWRAAASWQYLATAAQETDASGLPAWCVYRTGRSEYIVGGVQA